MYPRNDIRHYSADHPPIPESPQPNDLHGLILRALRSQWLHYAPKCGPTALLYIRETAPWQYEVKCTLNKPACLDNCAVVAVGIPRDFGDYSGPTTEPDETREYVQRMASEWAYTVTRQLDVLRHLRNATDTEKAGLRRLWYLEQWCDSLIDARDRTTSKFFAAELDREVKRLHLAIKVQTRRLLRMSK